MGLIFAGGRGGGGNVRKEDKKREIRENTSMRKFPRLQYMKVYSLDFLH